MSWLSRRRKKGRSGGDSEATPGVTTSPLPKVTETGLKALWSPHDAIADIVFVHGLTGHREATWTSIESKSPWPKELLPNEVPNARILTFGYDARVWDWRSIISQNRIGNHSRNLLHAIANYRDRDNTSSRPIFLVAHSLGGLVCEDALLVSKNSASEDVHLKTLIETTRGIIFMGTPHSGAGLATWAVVLSKSLGLFNQTTSEILEVLKRDSEVLARIQAEFHTMVREMAQNGKTLAISCFYEELPLPGIGVVVAMDSSILPAYPHIGISKNHRDMTKFSSCEDTGFLNVSSELRRWVKKIEEIQASLANQSSTLHILAAQTAQNVVFELPYSRNPNFVKRSTIMSELKSRLELERYVALSGIGGVGKSEIAIEYCYQFQEINPHGSVFWIPTDTIAKFEQAYATLARKLCLPKWDDPRIDHVPLVDHYLREKYQQPWIMVLDNADDLDMLIKPQMETRSAPLESFVPRSSHGQIIITTRDDHVGQVVTQGKAPIEVHPLSVEDAEMLFCSSLLYESEANGNVVQQIVNILDFLPLAITQAAAYINWNKISIKQYLIELSESDAALQSLLSEDMYDTRRGYDKINSVIRSWKLSFDVIERKYSRAARLLCVMALLNRQNIPRDLLWRCDESQQQLTSALGILQSFSLIKAEHGSNTYSMHRLVQFVTCVWQKTLGTKAIHQQEALDLVVAKYPVSDTWSGLDSEGGKLFQLLLPHAQAVQSYASIDGKSQIALATLKFNMSSSEFKSGHYLAARELCEAAYNIRQVILGLDHLETLHAAALLGAISTSQGRYAEAENIQESTLKQKEKLLGADHIDTIQSASDLIDIYVRRGELKKADELAEQVLASRRKILGHKHRKTISSIRTCAHIAAQRGSYEKAEGLARHALDQNKEVLGPEHSVTIACESLLASILSEQGRYQEAIMLSENTLKLRESLLGSKHPHTLNAINNIARLRRLTGEFDLSEALYRGALLSYENTVGPENPDTLACASNLTVVLRDRGKFEEAEALCRQTLERRERILGPENPRTMITLDELAKLLDKIGNLEEAESCASRAIAVRRKVLGEAHPQTLNSKSTLVRIWAHKGKSDLAKNLLEDVLKVRRGIQRADHPDILADQSELAIIINKDSPEVGG